MTARLPARPTRWRTSTKLASTAAASRAGAGTLSFMAKTTVRLTREELHDLVWSRPMTEIAAEFGMSSVAFAKHCKTADVPRPGRGYWQQREAGQKPKRDKLPKRRDDVPASVAIDKYPRPGLGRRPPAKLPSVGAPAKVNKYHPVAAAVCAAAHASAHHPRGVVIVRGQREMVLRMAESNRGRVLWLLHALFVAAEERGCTVRFTKGQQWEASSLQLLMDGAPVDIAVREHLQRKAHEKAKWERDMPDWLARKYDLEPSGKLLLELDVSWGAETTTRWRDGEKSGRLEERLGEVLWALEEARRGLAAHRAGMAERERLAEVARADGEVRRREREEAAEAERRWLAEVARAAAHRKALGDDLLRAASAWQQASTVRAFVSAVATAIPEDRREPHVGAWFEWAATFCRELDPLSAPMTVPRAVVPG
jgi:hypothetical protein